MHQIRQLFDGRRLANDCGRIFQDPDISKNIFCFPALPAINDTLGAYRPTSETGSLNSAEMLFGVLEIFARERKRVRSAGNGVVVGEVTKTITVSLSRLMNSACANQIRPRSDSPSLRNARTDGHTDRQTDRHLSFIYIQAPTPGFARGTTHASCFSFALHSAAVDTHVCHRANTTRKWRRDRSPL